MGASGRPNVLLLVMDTARARTVFGDDGPALPAIERLREQGAWFTDAFADAPWTLPSHASLFTGVSPSAHGAHADHQGLDDGLRTLAASLSDAGYRTGSVTNNAWVTSEFGMSRGFDDEIRVWQYFQSDHDVGPLVMRDSEGRQYLDVLERLFAGNPVKNLANAVYGRFGYRRSDYGAARTNRLVERWLGQGNDPFFLFVNYLEPHLEYRPPERFADRFLDCSYEEAMAVPQEPWAYLCGSVELTDRELSILADLYRAEIAYLDHRIGELVDRLRAEDRWEDTICVVVGDHGENIGDYGLMDHQYCLRDTLLHVPLVVAGGPFDGIGRVTDPVQLSDVYPTLLDVLDIDDDPARRQFQGRSMAPGRTPRDVVVAEYLAPQPSVDTLRDRFGPLPDDVERHDRRLRAVRTDEWKLIRGSDGSRRLYDLDEDPAELEDVSGERPGALTDLEERLDGWLASVDRAGSTGEVSISAGTERRLADLGYL